MIEDLYPFQKEGVEIVSKALSTFPHAYILADDMGLGKTHQAIAIVQGLDVSSVLVVCPASGREEWERILENFTDESYNVIYDRRGLGVEDARFTVISYDLYWRVVDKMPVTEMVILDEFHRIKNRKAKRTKAILKQNFPYKLFMSGTPVLNRTEELWTTLHYIDPKEWGPYPKFIKRYCKTRKMEVWSRKWRRSFSITIICGSRRIDELKGRIRPIMLRRTKAEILPQLPPRTCEKLFVDLSPAQKKVYKEIEEELAIAIEEDREQAVLLKTFVKLRMACQMVRDEKDKPHSSKLKALKELAEDLISSGHKMFVVTPFVDTAVCAYEALEGHGAVLVTGSTPKEEARASRALFQRGEAKVYVGTIRANMEAITLTQADYMVFIGKELVPAINAQVADRIYRIGQERPVTVIEILTRKTVEDRIETLLEEKKKLFDQLIERGTLRNFLRLLI